MRFIATAVAVAAAVACSDSFSPTTENVAGTYSLRWLFTTNPDGAVEWRERGATFTISLAENGTTTGFLFVPGADEGGGDFTADMAGTWTLSGDTVRFAQTADSFVRDWPFFARQNRLVLDHQDATGVYRTRAVLEK